MSLYFSSSNDFRFVAPHLNFRSFFSKEVMEVEITLNFGMKQRKNPHNPRKLLTSDTLVGGFKPLIALIFDLLTFRLSLPTTNSRNMTSGMWKVHFSKFA